MQQGLVDDHLILYAGNDVYGCTNAVSAGCTGTVTLASPPHFGQIDTSILNTRFRRCAQVMALCCCSGVLSSFPCRVRPLPRLTGVNIDTVFAVWVMRHPDEHAMESGQVYSRLWNQGCQLRDKVQRLEDDMGRAITVRRL